MLEGDASVGDLVANLLGDNERQIETGRHLHLPSCNAALVEVDELRDELGDGLHVKILIGRQCHTRERGAAAQFERSNRRLASRSSTRRLFLPRRSETSMMMLKAK